MARRVLGGALLVGLTCLIAVQALELVRHQRRQPFDRRLALRPETDVGALASIARSDEVRTRYALWYWVARELPGVTIYVPTGNRLLGHPVSVLGNIEIRWWDRRGSLELSYKAAARLEARATHRFEPDGGPSLHLLDVPGEREYVLMTRDGVPFLLLPRSELGPGRSRRAGAAR